MQVELLLSRSQREQETYLWSRRDRELLQRINNKLCRMISGIAAAITYRHHLFFHIVPPRDSTIMQKQPLLLGRRLGHLSSDILIQRRKNPPK